MADITGTSQWQLNTQEIGYHVGDDTLAKSSTSFKIYIPNILPMIEQGKALITPLAIDASCFINASDCALSPEAIVNSANYIDVPAIDNMNFQRPVLPYGAKVTVGNKGNSVDNLYITNFSDSSTYNKSKSITTDYKSSLASYFDLGGN